MSDQPSPAKRRRLGRPPRPPVLGPLSTPPVSLPTTSGPLQIPIPDLTHAPRSPLILDKLPDDINVDETMKNLLRWQTHLRDGLRLRDQEPDVHVPQITYTDIDVSNAPSSPSPPAPGAPNTNAADQLSSGEDATTPLSVWNWEDAPIYQGRDFVVVGVSKSTVERKAQHEGPHMITFSVEVWSIFVQDKNRPDSPKFEVYGRDKRHQYQRFVGSKTTSLSMSAGAVDLSICADENDARELGAHVCNLMNRMPFDLSAAVWERTIKGPDDEPQLELIRRLVQARALDLWQPSFDRLRLPEDQQDLKLCIASSRAASRTADFYNDHGISATVRYLSTSTKPGWSFIRVTIHYSKLDVDKVHALPDVPADFVYKYAPVRGATTGNQRLLLKAFHLIQYSLSFKVGGKGDIMQHLDREMAKMYRGNQLGTSVVTPNLLERQPALWTVLHGTSSVIVRPSAYAGQLCVGKVPNIFIGSTSGAMIAHVLNRMLAMQIRKRDILNTWQVGLLEGDLVSNKRITQGDVKQGYCSCRDTSEQGHICMICHRQVLCSRLLKTPDGRRVCRSHELNAFEMNNDRLVTMTLRRRLLRVIETAQKSAKRDVSPGRIPSTKAFQEKLSPSILTSKTWKDWYAHVRSLDDILLGSSPRGSSPAQMSLDAIHNIFFADGQIVQHHPENVALTAHCLNYLKGVWGASILPAMGAAATQTLKESNGAARDEALWADFHNTTDRLHRLSLQVTSLASARKKLTPDQVDAEFMKVHLDSLRSSLWHPEQPSPIRNYKRRLPMTLGEVRQDDPRSSIQHLLQAGLNPSKLRLLSSKVSMPVFLPWEENDKERLTKVVKEMQADPLINPKGLEIMWSAKGAPWPFRKDHMFTDDVDLWDWLFEEVHKRLQRMCWLCNVGHDTSDSPDTIFLEIVVQWFRNGGTYDYIHCEMTVYQKHALCISLGRSSKVKPGSPMITGWTVSRPSSLSRHYDMNRSTIAVQPQCINLFWSDFYPESHPQMFQMLCDLPEQTVYYGKFLRHTPKVEYRKESLVSKRRRGSVIGDENMEDMEDEDLHAEMRAQGLIEDEEQSDEEHGETSDEEGPGDVPREQVEFLEGTLHVLISEMADRDPEFLDTQQCQELLRKLRSAARSGEEDVFSKLQGDLIDIVQKRIDGTSSEQTHKCCVCSLEALDDMMLRCANPAHIDAVFHFTCVEGLTAMPEGDLTMLCPKCKLDESRKGSAGSASGHRNMVNLGSTCYMSSSVQILRHLGPIFNLPSDTKGLLAKPDALSGRTPREWLPGCYRFVPGTPDAEISEISSKHMDNAKALCEAFIALSNHLGTPGAPSHHQTSQFFGRVQEIDPSDWKNEMNDSAALLNTLIECMLLTTDDSVPSGRGRLTKLNSVQHQAEEPLPQLVEDSSVHYTAYVGEGRMSVLTGSVCVQFAKEYACECGAISRSFEHVPVLDLDLPTQGADSDEFGLIKMLENWVSDLSDMASDTPRVCSACGNSAVRMLYRKITISPNILVISFKRLAGARLEHVDLPEYLDLSPYADNAHLPSDPGPSSIKFRQQPIYRLVAINMYIPGMRHYISYILVDGTWLVFDDMSRQPTPRHPQAAISEGHIPYYAVYQQLKGKTALPVDGSGYSTMGHMFTTDKTSPDAKVADLYATTSTPPTGDAFPPPGGSAVLTCPHCDFHTSHQEEFDQHMSRIHVMTLQCPNCDSGFSRQNELEQHLSSVHPLAVFEDQATRDAHLHQAHSAVGDMPTTQALHTVQQQLRTLHLQQGEIKATLDTYVQGAAPAEESLVMQLLRQIQQQQAEMQVALKHQAQQQQAFEDKVLKRRELERLQAVRAQDEDRSRDLMARSDEMMAMGRALRERASEFQQRSQQITAREQELQQELGME
ncbi:hypothetical protein MBLNU13_g09392t2 [Cladosporium sp. NU13]